jgi:cytochrome oxidase Cu insertion factor (SCO1/SenC/PrrC family)/Cu/Ag efflux protein CusF
MTARPLLLSLSLLLAGPAPAADAQHTHPGAPPIPVDGPDLRASATVDPQGRLWVVTHEHGRVLVRRSDDAGTSWTTPVVVNPAAETLDPGGDARPKVLVSAGGEVFVTWTQALSKPYSGAIRLARSLDGGRTFTAPLTVHRHREEITHRFDALAFDGQGRLFVAWIDKRDAVAAAGATPKYRGAALYFAVSEDRGATFKGDFKAADHACECCRIALATDPAGRVHAMWRHIFEPNIRDHATARLNPDGTASGFRRATTDNWRLDACPHHGPSLAFDAQGTAHTVWFTADAEGGVAAYGQLGAGALPESRRRLGGKFAAHADLAVAGRRVAVAWREFADGRMQLRAVLSEDAGATWREQAVTSVAGATGQPRVLARGGSFLIFWHTAEQPLRVHALEAAAAPQVAAAPRYDLRGEVIALTPDGNGLIVHHEEIPGYMPAMTMEFLLQGAKPADFREGQKIRARMYESAPGEFKLEDIRTESPAPGSAPKKGIEHDAFVELGEHAPEFQLLNQLGEKVGLERYRGKRIVLNFIFTRCPVATMCPAATARMISLQRQAAEREIKDFQLLSISMDPIYDTPEVLREYAEARGVDPVNFQFLTGSEAAVRRLLAQFGVIAEPSENIWKHTLATVLIDRDGRITQRVEGSTWDPEIFLRLLQ